VYLFSFLDSNCCRQMEIWEVLWTMCAWRR
jgi:hypothetical protein